MTVRSGEARRMEARTPVSAHSSSSSADPLVINTSTSQVPERGRSVYRRLKRSSGRAPLHCSRSSCSTFPRGAVSCRNTKLQLIKTKTERKGETQQPLSNASQNPDATTRCFHADYDSALHRKTTSLSAVNRQNWDDWSIDDSEQRKILVPGLRKHNFTNNILIIGRRRSSN